LQARKRDCASPGTDAGDIDWIKHSVIYFRRYTLMKRRSERGGKCENKRSTLWPIRLAEGRRLVRAYWRPSRGLPYTVKKVVIGEVPLGRSVGIFLKILGMVPTIT
jgi:hypothetical protein